MKQSLLEEMHIKLIIDSEAIPAADIYKPNPTYLELDYKADQGSLTLGRQARNNIVLPFLSISRQHAEFRRYDQTLVICDLNSANGTFVNRIPLAPGQEYQLKSGDIIVLGRVPLKIWVNDDTVEPPTQKPLTALPETSTPPQPGVSPLTRPTPSPFKKIPFWAYDLLFITLVGIIAFGIFQLLPPDVSTILSTLLLLLLLALREAISGLNNPLINLTKRVLKIVAFPLLIVFLINVVSRIIEMVNIH